MDVLKHTNSVHLTHLRGGSRLLRGGVGLACFLWLILLALPAWAQDFGGTWDSTYGTLELTSDGTTVTGSYSYGGGSRVSGTIDGARLNFTYTEPTASGEGYFDISDDGQSLNGLWRETGTSDWHPWVATLSTSTFRMPDLSVEGNDPFDGLFDSTYGRVRLVETDGAVVGSYSYSGGSTITGTVEDGRMTFQYTEPDAAGEGWFQIAADGESFSGQWRANGTSEWAGWDGTRVHPEPDTVWLVVIEAHWEYTIAEQEYAFGDMLNAYFARYPNVNVRHRRMHDLEDFNRAGEELAYLAEPVALLIASHGTNGEMHVNGDAIGAEAIAAVLGVAPNVFLVHFSSCEIMVGNTAQSILDRLGSDRHVALSGYEVAVDWSASALLEFLFLDLILGQGFSPESAAALVRAELNFAGDVGTAGSPLGGSRFRTLVQ